MNLLWLVNQTQNFAVMRRRICCMTYRSFVTRAKFHNFCTSGRNSFTDRIKLIVESLKALSATSIYLFRSFIEMNGGGLHDEFGKQCEFMQLFKLRSRRSCRITGPPQTKSYPRTHTVWTSKALIVRQKDRWRIAAFSFSKSQHRHNLINQPAKSASSQGDPFA